MICKVTGEECRIVSRVELLGIEHSDIVQCLDCSIVYQAVGWAPRICAHCGLAWGESLHDPCLGRIEGVSHACCGHGDPEKAYMELVAG